MMKNIRRKYRMCIWNAKQRDIPWELTYIQWRTIWAASGHWHERGFRKGQYVMARYGDKGPYSKDNVRICTVKENHVESLEILFNKKHPWLGKKLSISHRKKISQSLLGRKFSLAHKEKLSQNKREYWKHRKEKDTVIS